MGSRLHRCCVSLLLVACLAVAQAAGQVCNSSRALSSRRFGFLKAGGHGVDDSYAYLVFLLNMAASGPDMLQCSTAGLSNSNYLAAMQKVEAAVWAVESFRSRFPGQLPNVTLGALVLDACQSPAQSVLHITNLQTCETTFGDVGSRVQPDSAVAFVGVDTLAEATVVAPVLRSVGKAGISYELSASSYDNSSFPLLARVAPSDLAEADALVALVAAVGAGHAQIVYSADTAGRYAGVARELRDRLTGRGVCVVNSIMFSSSAAATVNSFTNVRPVVLLLTSSDLAGFSASMRALRPANGAFTWLFLSERARSLNGVVAGAENFFAGSLSLAPTANATGYANFQTYFKTLNPNTPGLSTRNPWMSDFWSQYFRCNLPNATATHPRSCNYSDATQNLQTVSSFDAAAARIIQSVDLSLNSLELTRRELCPSTSGLCPVFLSSPSRFQSLYRNMYNGSRSSRDLVDLSMNGGPMNYTLLIWSFRKTYPGHMWASVGSYESGMLQLTASPPAYNVDERNTTWATSCSAACQAMCPVNGSTTSAISTTPASAAGTPGTLRRRNWVYALITCACVGIIVCFIFIVYIIMKVLGLPDNLKNFSTLWSGQVLLFVILIGYITLFAWVPWPTSEACGIIRFMVGFVYAAIFCLLLVKLLNLMNSFLPPEYQLLLFFLSLAVQVATAIEWLILVPTSVSLTPAGSQCGHSFLEHLQALVYCMLLILLCTLLAMRAHSIGKNNREALFIGCAAGISIPIWIAWALVGSLTTGQDFQDASMAFGLFVNLTLILLVIFLPKINQLRQVTDSTESEEYDDGDIYVLTQGAPSVKSEGAIYVTPAGGSGNPVGILALPTLQNGSHSPVNLRTRSLSGGPPGAIGNALTLTQDLRGISHSSHKAYSDYGAGFRRQTSKDRPPRLESLPENPKGSETAAKTRKLEQLGYL